MTDDLIKALVARIVRTVPPGFTLVKSEEVPLQGGEKILVHAFTDGLYRITTSLNAYKSPAQVELQYIVTVSASGKKKISPRQLRRIERAFFVKGALVTSQKSGAAYQLRATVRQSTATAATC